MMDHVIQTYPDGSEMTVKHFAVATAISAVSGTIAVVAAMSYQDWKQRRRMKKALAVLKSKNV